MRRSDWAERLIAAIDANQALPFVWGETDCMQFVMGCAEAMTDVHPYPKAKGYRTQRGAMACLKRHGFTTIVEALAAKYPPVSVAMAQRGDIGIIAQGDSFCALVCDGASFVGKSLDGNIRVPRETIIQAFRVE